MNLRNSPHRFAPFAENSESCGLEISRRKSRQWRWTLLAAVSAMLFAGPSTAQAKQKSLDQVGRINLIRGLDREVAVAKVVLPLGKYGVFVNDKGQLDEERAQKELRMNGPGVKAGMPVEITKIRFKPHRIIFEINGGGKKHEKWYQHIQMVGVGVSKVPTQQDMAAASGSYINLTFQDGKVPDLSVKQVKELLHGVLDFHRRAPTALYSPDVPKRFKEAIKKHQALVGMNRDEVLSSKGPPLRKVRQTKPNGEETEDWLYGLPPHVLFVTFKNDSVVKVHQY